MGSKGSTGVSHGRVAFTGSISGSAYNIAINTYCRSPQIILPQVLEVQQGAARVANEGGKGLRHLQNRHAVRVHGLQRDLPLLLRPISTLASSVPAGPWCILLQRLRLQVRETRDSSQTSDAQPRTAVPGDGVLRQMWQEIQERIDAEGARSCLRRAVL